MGIAEETNETETRKKNSRHFFRGLRRTAEERKAKKIETSTQRRENGQGTTQSDAKTVRERPSLVLQHQSWSEGFTELPKN